MRRHLPRGDSLLFKIGEIRELIRLLDETSVSELTIVSGDDKLCIKKPDVSGVIPQVQVAPSMPVQATIPAVSAAAPVAEPQAPLVQGATPAQENDEATTVITSPMVGTFYRSPSPDAPAYVEVGSRVTTKTIVCIVEAMKLMNEIEAEVSGVVTEVMAENGQLVEYGQPLFKIKRS